MHSRRDFVLAFLGSALGVVVALSPTFVRAEQSIDYLRDVRQILAEHCFQCHGPDAAQRQSGLRLDQREGAVSRLESGKTAIVPGESSASELVRRIESADSDLVMPPLETKRQLTKAQQQILRQWDRCRGALRRALGLSTSRSSSPTTDAKSQLAAKCD